MNVASVRLQIILVSSLYKLVNDMKSLTLSLLTVVLAGTAAADEHRELGPHEHGHGILNIAVEKNRVSMDLDVPGMDVVGFEHQPNTPEQKATAKRAEAALAEALSLFKMPDGAGCKVAEAKVSIEAEGAHDGAETKESAAKPTDEPAEKAAGGEPEGHNDYNVSYVLECEKPAAITTIQFGYFKAFEGAKALTVNVVSEKAQNSYEVTREKPLLDLGGTM